MEGHDEKLLNPGSLVLGPLTFFPLLQFSKNGYRHDTEALSTADSGKECMRDIVEVKNHVQSLKLYVALYINECWEITGKTKFITDSFIKEKSYTQFYRVGVLLRTVVFDLGYQLWAELYFSHSFNQHYPAFLSLFSIIRSSFPGLRNSKRCFIYPNSKLSPRYWMLGAGALGRPRGMEWGGRREEGSGWGTHVYLWRIHFDIWQN